MQKHFSGIQTEQENKFDVFHPGPGYSKTRSPTVFYHTDIKALVYGGTGVRQGSDI